MAQTGQFLDVLHRPGNVHDSKGALAFIVQCIQVVKQQGPKARLEARVDAAFFDEKILQGLADQGVEFTVSVPFERLPRLKQVVEQTQPTDWLPIDEQWAYAPTDWQPKSWTRSFRFVLLRRRRPVQRKGPLQLDLFVPRDYVYEYKVVATNKGTSAAALFFHHGRGSQEGLIGEAKDACALDYIPQRRRVGNQLFCTTALLAHNLCRELQMSAAPRATTSEPQRPALWRFETLRRLRSRLFTRPGRLIQPQGALTLITNLEEKDQQAFQRYLAPLIDTASAAA